MQRCRGWFMCALFLVGGCAELIDLAEQVGGPRGGPKPPPGSGDAGGLPDTAGPPPPPVPCDTSQNQNRILIPKCTICHGAVMPASGLDLLSGDVRQRLLVGRSMSCSARPFVVVSGNEVGGHFFDKLAGAIPGCGNQMPFGGVQPLSPYEVQCLRDWFLPGSKPPPPPPPPDLDAGSSPDLPDDRHSFSCADPEQASLSLFTGMCVHCHNGDSSSALPDLRAPGLRQRLLTTASHYCGSRPLVTQTAGRVEGYLFDKFAGPVPGCGTQMPFGSIPPLSPYQVECVRTWLSTPTPPAP